MTATNPPLEVIPTPSSASNQEQLLRGAGLVYASTIFQLVGRLGLTFLIARTLGTEGIGVFSLGFVTVQALSMFATNGQDFGLLKFVGPAFKIGDQATIRRMTDAALITSLSAAIVLMVGTIIIFPYFVFNSTGSEQAGRVAAWFAPGIVLQTAFVLLSSLGLACGRVRVKALSDRVFGMITQLAVTAVLLWLGWGLWSVVIGFLAASLVTLLAALVMMSDLYPRHIKVTERGRAIRELFGFSWKLGLSNAANYVLLNAALLILGSISAAQAGLYAAASRLTLLGLLFLDAFGTNMASHAAGRMNEPSLAIDFRRVTLWMIVLSAPIFIVLFAFAEQWMSFLGPEFAAGAPVLRVLAFAQMLNMLTGNAGVLIALSNRPGLRVLNTVVVWGTNLILILLLAPQYGALGAAIAYLCAMILTDTLEYIQTRFLLNMSPWNTELIKPLLLILLGAGLMIAIDLQLKPDFIQAILLAILFVAAYGLTMLLIGLPPADIQMLKRAANRFTARQAQTS